MLTTFDSSWEIIAHNTVIWTGDVVIDYKILLILLALSVIRTKL
ncbi:hypothetical protein [Turicimonas muris]|nr:hypothetical protein [Turicimonas muris]